MPADGATDSVADLRVHRMITADGRRLVAPPAVPAQRRPTPAASLDPDGGAPAEPSVDVAAPASPRVAARRADARIATDMRSLPVLPGTNLDQPLRRVSLPRAMSRAHRPDPRRTGTRRAVDSTAASDHRSATAPTIAADVLRRASVRPPVADLPTLAEPAPARNDATTAAPADVVRRLPSSSPTPVAPSGNVTHAAGRARSSAGAMLADRFMIELAQTARPQAAPLPTPFRSMAEHIAGRRPVMLSTDTVSRRALRSVGKRAATVGDTIHLDAPAHRLVAPDRRLAEVVAHELTHVAHASPAPRFFDDVDESPEERRADRVARAMTRGPLSPTASTLPAPHLPSRPAAPSGAPVIRRIPSTPASPGTINAADLAASITGTSASDVVRRMPTTTKAPERPQQAAPASPMTAPRPPQPAAEAPTNAPSANAAPGAAVAISDEAFRAQLERNLDVILRRVEDHIMIDIERRGGRSWRGF